MKINEQKETILITGGAGFIGSTLTEKLLRETSHHIICLDNLNDYYTPQWKRQNIESFHSNTNFSFYGLDILDNQIKAVFEKNKITKIVHLAARAGVRPSLESPLLYEQVNVLGTIRLLELAKGHRVQQVIFGSSSSVYGNQVKTPFCETDRTDYPISPYASTKKTGELLCAAYSQKYHLPITALRFFTVYGPKGRPDMAPYKFVKAVLNGEEITQYGEGNTKRDYTYVDDIVDGIIKALEKPFPFEVINLGNHNPVTLKEFITTIEIVTGKTANIKKLPMQPGDVEQTYADISKPNKLLDWEPKVNLDEGLKCFVEWYKRERM